MAPQTISHDHDELEAGLLQHPTHEKNTVPEISEPGHLPSQRRRPGHGWKLTVLWFICAAFSLTLILNPWPMTKACCSLSGTCSKQNVEAASVQLSKGEASIDKGNIEEPRESKPADSAESAEPRKLQRRQEDGTNSTSSSSTVVGGSQTPTSSADPPSSPTATATDPTSTPDTPSNPTRTETPSDPTTSQNSPTATHTTPEQSPTQPTASETPTSPPGTSLPEDTSSDSSSPPPNVPVPTSTPSRSLPDASPTSPVTRDSTYPGQTSRGTTLDTLATSSEETSTAPEPTNTEQMTSSAVEDTIVSTLPGGGMTTITSTSWVEVAPSSKPTSHPDSDPGLQNAGSQLSEGNMLSIAVFVVVGYFLVP